MVPVVHPGPPSYPPFPSPTMKPWFRADPAHPPAKFRPFAGIRPTAVCLLALALSTLGVRAQVSDSLANGAYQPGTLASAGKTDTWTFSATAGSGIVLRMGGVSLTPRIRLFAPDHSPVADSVPGNTLFRDGFLSVVATNAGPYTAIVSSTYTGQIGDYQLHLARPPSMRPTSPPPTRSAFPSAKSTARPR